MMFEIKKRIDFFDCDPAGVLFFGNVFHLAHHAYELFLEKLQPNTNFFKHEKLLLPIIHSEADYSNPLYSGDEAIIHIVVSKLKTSSFELSYKISRDKMECCKVKTVHVCVDKSNWEKSPLPEELKSKLEKYLQH